MHVILVYKNRNIEENGGGGVSVTKITRRISYNVGEVAMEN
jgi:hypothetical protein